MVFHGAITVNPEILILSTLLRIFPAQPLVRVVVVRDRIELSTFR